MGSSPWLAFKAWPLPAALLDEQFRLLDMNASYEAFVGRSRQALLGTDPIALQPLAERESAVAERARQCQAVSRAEPSVQWRGRLLLSPAERWVVHTLHPVPVAPGDLQADAQAHPSAPALAAARGAWVALLQDVTPEYAAREQARRAQDELGQWFQLAQAGMLVYDETGLIVRCNAALEALVERVPEVLAQATPPLQWLLGWTGGCIDPALVAGGPPVLRQALVPLANGSRRRLVARLALMRADAQAPRESHVMAVVEDRSAEDERDLAQLERSMLVDAARVGVATYDPARGSLVQWEEGAAGGETGETDVTGGKDVKDATAGTQSATGLPSLMTVSQDAGAAGALFNIGRSMVLAPSRPEYERLQRALRAGIRAEVRYEVQHPQWGRRWLLTRVEPGALAGGRATTSVVTLDVTDQEHALHRNEQLLRELTTILDSSTAGIAYLRGPVLVRCNRRFERMLGFEPGESAGASLQELLARQSAPAATINQALQALEAGRAFETELELPGHTWVALSLRRAETEAGSAEAVAVLTDVTRLKQQQSELEALLRERDLMFNLSEVGIVYLRGARVERANQAVAALTGYSVPELLTMDWSALHESSRACADFEAAMSMGLHAAGRFGAEMRLRQRDGQVRWVQVSARPVQVAAEEDASLAPMDGLSPTREITAGVSGPESSITRDMICSLVDVDERYRTRETLRVQAERTRELLNSVLVGIVTVSARGIDWMNRSACRMFGGELLDFIGEPIHLVATPEPDHPLRRADWLAHVAAGPVQTFECRLRGRDGREFWVVGNAVASALANEAAQVTFAFLDIERRRQAEVSIARAQASLQHMIETAPLAIALFDAAALSLLQMNQGAAVFLGLSAKPAREQTVQDCAPALAQALATWLQEAVHTGQALVREWRDETSPALRVWDCRIAPLQHEGDAGHEVILVASDVTEQRAAEQARLSAAIAQREVLVREVHHRIKNNLQGVAGLLQQHAVRRPEVATVLTEAVAQVQAIAQVYGLQVGVQGPLAVAPLVRSIALSVQRTFGRPIVMAQNDAEIDGLDYLLPEVETIPFALVVNELLTNAIKHGQGPAVHCAVLAQGDDFTLSIAGQGCLPAGFDVTAIRAGVSGLALVRALLPRRHASLSLQAEGDQVVARVTLRPPSVRRAS